MIPDFGGWLLELMEGQPPVPRQYEFHCHPDVVLALREASDRQTFGQYRPPPSLHVGGPLFGSAAIVVKPDLGPGGWELRENGQVVKSGRIGGEHG